LYGFLFYYPHTALRLYGVNSISFTSV
jgi:hypothetical protein